jgi:glycosyltransferase involved in cell wall biosynthesis
MAVYCSSHGIPFCETGSRFSSQLRFLHRVRASHKIERVPLGRLLIDGLARLLGARPGPQHAFGRYVLHDGGAAVKIAIDAFDSGEIQSDETLKWCDVYFKTNYWPTRTYPAKVLPIANLNPDVLPHLSYLREARKADKEWDLCAFFRVWGGSNELEGIEHNLAIFEALARVKCRKYLLASVVSGDVRATVARLERAGVPWTTAWVPRSEVWRIASHSRLNVVRHGMHECIPWRMTDILAMGGCPVLDYASTTRWHVPLVENVHYLNLGAPYNPSPAAEFDRDEVAGRVEAWLADPDRLRQIGQNTARYFDEHLTPEKLGAYIIDTARPHLPVQ